MLSYLLVSPLGMFQTLQIISSRFLIKKVAPEVFGVTFQSAYIRTC